MISERLNIAADRLNPIVVKELRQAVRGQAALGLVYGFLLVQIVVFALALMRFDVSGFHPQAGLDLFRVISFVMLPTLLLGVPIYAGLRTHFERVSEHLMMVQLTGVGFPRIFWGKFLSAMVVNLLILSTMMPFAFVATLLRGVGLLSIAAVSAITLVCSAICTIGMLAIGCLMVGPVSRVLWGLVCLFCFGVMVVYNNGMNMVIMESGAWSGIEWMLCPSAGVTLIAGIALLVLYQAAKHRLAGLGDSQYLRNLEYQPWYVKMQTGGNPAQDG